MVSSSSTQAEPLASLGPSSSSASSDRGEQRLHPEEPLLPAGGGDALLASPRQPGAGRPAGLLLPGQGAGLPLLGQEEAGQEEAGLAGRQGSNT